MEIKTLPLGEIIFREGDQSTEAYRLLAGCVEISIEADGQKVVLAHLAPGDIFGEMAMIDEHPRSATAMTLQDSQMEVLTPDDFNQCIIQNPAILMPYLASFFERLRTTNERLRMELRKQDSFHSSSALLERARADVLPCASTGTGLPLRVSGRPDPYHRSVAHEPEIAAPRHIITLRVADPNAIPLCPDSQVQIEKFPYRIGREEHHSVPSVFSTNDFVLHDERPYQVSRNHCSIECEGDRIFIRDRGSMVGTIVNGERLGAGESALTADLQPGENTLILGMESSVFKFTLDVQAA